MNALDIAAAGAICAAAHRCHASETDRDTALRVLLATPQPTPPRPVSKLSEGHPLSPADKTRIRELLTAGHDTAAIASEVGCSTQAVAGVRVGMQKRAHA